ncbi:hypothetical protein Tco_0444202, partial [Tanacetum coccineum]
VASNLIPTALIPIVWTLVLVVSFLITSKISDIASLSSLAFGSYIGLRDEVELGSLWPYVLPFHSCNKQEMLALKYVG